MKGVISSKVERFTPRCFPPARETLKSRIECMDSADSSGSEDVQYCTKWSLWRRFPAELHVRSPHIWRATLSYLQSVCQHQINSVNRIRANYRSPIVCATTQSVEKWRRQEGNEPTTSRGVISHYLTTYLYFLILFLQGKLLTTVDKQQTKENTTITYI